MFLLKEYENRLREYKLEVLLEDWIINKDIDYYKTYNRNNQLKTLCYGQNFSNETEEGNYHFFLLSYSRKSMFIQSEFSINKDKFEEKFNFENSYFEEINKIILEKFDLVLDAKYINKKIHKEFNSIPKESNKRIRLYEDDKFFIYVDIDNYSSIDYTNMIKLMYRIDIKNT